MASRRGNAPPPAPEAPVASATPAEPEAPAEPTTEAPPPPAPEAPVGLVRCKALRTTLAGGVPQYEGDEFMLWRDVAEKLAARGDIKIL